MGHRAVFIGGVQDPILIGQLDEFLARLQKLGASIYPELASGEARVDVAVYGRDAVMGPLEPSTAVPHEVGVLGQVTAPTPELAKAICTTFRVGVLHLHYPGQIATAGNLALPLNPMDNAIGPVCAFTVSWTPPNWTLSPLPTPQSGPRHDRSRRPRRRHPEQERRPVRGDLRRDVHRPRGLSAGTRVGDAHRERMAALYRLEDSAITYCDFFEPALAFKLTHIRAGAQGGIAERDTFGAQQHAPLLDLDIPDV